MVQNYILLQAESDVLFNRILCLVNFRLSSVCKESAMFWDGTEPRFVVSYRRFGTTYRVPVSMVKQSKKNLDNGTDRLPRNVIRIINYTSRLRNISEQ